MTTLTILGSAGTHPGPGRACSSYLVEADDYRLLLDCGNGSLANLQRVADVADVDALLLSHLHPDHFADVYGLYYARRFHPSGQSPVDVYAPPGAEAFLGQLLPADSRESFARLCRFHTAAPGATLELGPLEVTLFAARHPVEALASRVRQGDDVLAYSGDSADTPELVDCARDADVFLCDATWLTAGGPYPDGVHMTGRQAGALAARAGAGRLVVTHVYPALDPVQVAAEAAGAFGGEIMVAQDLLRVPLS
ncbi:MAG: MBL fold metallo-hydrolase [Actinobacteria bacterium]|nr:MBL fold metallo-hydrolase [Actinomycetota bacterium]